MKLAFFVGAASAAIGGGAGDALHRGQGRSHN